MRIEVVRKKDAASTHLWATAEKFDSRADVRLYFAATDFELITLPTELNEPRLLKQPPVAAVENVVPEDKQSLRNCFDSGISSTRKLTS